MLPCLLHFLLSVSLEAIAISPSFVGLLQNYGMHFPQSQNTMAPSLYHWAFSARHVSYRHRSFSFWQLMSHFPFALISQFHALHLFASQLLLDFVSLLLIVPVLPQAFSSQVLIFLVSMPLLSFEILYLPLLLSLLHLVRVLLLLFFSRHSLFLLSPSPELKPLLARLLFSLPLSFPAFYFPSLVYVPLHVHLPFHYISALQLLCLSLVAPSAKRASVSGSLIPLYVIFRLSLLLLSLQVSVFTLHVSVFPLSILVPSSLHVSVFLHPVFVSLHPVSSSSSFASYFPLSSID